MSALYVGIVGWNQHTQRLALMLHRELKGTEVLAMATRDPEGQAFAREVLGLKHIYTDPVPLYELHQLNIIHISSEAELHLDQVTNSLSSGTHVLIDQPLASNVTDCLAIEKVDRSHPNQKVMLSMPRRYDDRIIAIKKQIAEGKLGHVMSVSVESYESYANGSQLTHSQASKGIFMDLTLQDIDLLHFLTASEITSVYAVGSALMYPSLQRHGDADTAHIIAETDKDFVANFISSRAGHQQDGYRLKIVGTKGEITFDTRLSQTQLTIPGDTVPKASSVTDPYYLEAVKEFVATIREGNRLPYGLDVGTYATKIAVAMTKSFVLGEPVQIDA